uniref:Uncharacterized protein n=1 Tax=Rhodnius prolixus TaxID=13249 RepID=A0A4P6D8E8_RHOPR
MFDLNYAVLFDENGKLNEKWMKLDDGHYDNLMIMMHNLENISEFYNINLYNEIIALMKPPFQNEIHLFNVKAPPSKRKAYNTILKLISMKMQFDEIGVQNTIMLSEENKIYYRPMDQIMEDAQLLCLIYLLIGENIRSVDLDSSIRSLIDFLLDKYSIANCEDNISDSKPITVATLASTLPQCCCEYYSIGMIESPLSLDILGVEISEKNSAIYCRQFPSVATKHLYQDRTNIFPQLLWIAIQLCKYDDDEEYDNDVTKLWDYIKKTMFTPFLPEEIKFEKCLTWELIEENGKPASFWNQTRKICLYFLDEELSHHSQWSRIRRELQCICDPNDEI